MELYCYILRDDSYYDSKEKDFKNTLSFNRYDIKNVELENGEYIVKDRVFPSQTYDINKINCVLSNWDLGYEQTTFAEIIYTEKQVDTNMVKELLRKAIINKLEENKLEFIKQTNDNKYIYASTKIIDSLY